MPCRLAAVLQGTGPTQLAYPLAIGPETQAEDEYQIYKTNPIFCSPSYEEFASHMKWQPELSVRSSGSRLYPEAVLWTVRLGLLLSVVLGSASAYGQIELPGAASDSIAG